MIADHLYLDKPEIPHRDFLGGGHRESVQQLRGNQRQSQDNAMQFGDETKSIRESFRKAISESGYSVKIIDEKEHNNQIVPEIFFEIEQSLFVVVDIT